MLRQFVRFIAAALAFGACGVQAQPQTGFPVKPVRIVIPYPAGGPVDAAGRQIAKGMQEMLKQPVIVDNKPGASSTIGSAEVARAPADGHTVLLTLADSFTYVPHLFKKLPYDPFKDFAFVTQLALTPPVLILRTDAGVSGLKQIGPGGAALNYGTWGPGSYPHLIGSALARQTRGNLTIVAYKGGAPAAQDLMGGHIQMTIASIPQALDIQQKGLATISAIAGTQRSPLIPDVPTFVELGFTDPTFAVPIWLGLAAPAGTPVSVVSRLRDAAVAALKLPETQKFLQGFGWRALGNSPSEFRAAVEREGPVIAEAMRLAGVQPE